MTPVKKRRGILTTVFLLLVAAALLWHLFIIGEAVAYRWINPEVTPYMKLEAARLKAEKPGVKLRHQWIPLARMGNNIKRAVIASEDQKFLHHDGVDWDALELAMEKHIEKGKGGGGSTITQQVVKNVFLSHKKSYIRKGSTTSGLRAGFLRFISIPRSSERGSSALRRRHAITLAVAPLSYPVLRPRS